MRPGRCPGCAAERHVAVELGSAALGTPPSRLPLPQRGRSRGRGRGNALCSCCQRPLLQAIPAAACGSVKWHRNSSTSAHHTGAGQERAKPERTADAPGTLARPWKFKGVAQYAGRLQCNAHVVESKAACPKGRSGPGLPSLPSPRPLRGTPVAAQGRITSPLQRAETAAGPGAPRAPDVQATQALLNVHVQRGRGLHTGRHSCAGQMLGHPCITTSYLLDDDPPAQPGGHTGPRGRGWACGCTPRGWLRRATAERGRQVWSMPRLGLVITHLCSLPCNLPKLSRRVRRQVLTLTAPILSPT